MEIAVSIKCNSRPIIVYRLNRRPLDWDSGDLILVLALLCDLEQVIFLPSFICLVYLGNELFKVMNPIHIVCMFVQYLGSQSQLGPLRALP